MWSTPQQSDTSAEIFAKAKNGSVLYNQGLNQHITGADGIKALASLAFD